MKHVPGNIKDKYEILGVIGEGIDFIKFFNHSFIHISKRFIWCGAQSSKKSM
jgi:hypothetical protein